MDLDSLLRQTGQYTPMKSGDYDLSLVYGFGESVSESVDWSPDLNLHELLKCNGGRVHYVDFAVFQQHPKIFDKSIYVHKKNDFDIILPAYASMIENRFTLAHELGHYVLHSKLSGDKCFACSNGDTPIEKEANCFALGFMMPSKAFHDACKEFSSDRDLSMFFFVPVGAVVARRMSLGITR
jgi:Zn-dependent peptidase ImmA (M78 family)